MVALCRRYFKNNEAYTKWWSFTEGILYLKIGKYDITYCKYAEDIFTALMKSGEFNENPSLLLFFIGHIYYEMGKLVTDIEASINYYNQAQRCFKRIENQTNDNIYEAIINNMLGNISLKSENLSRSNDKSYSEAENYYIKALNLYPQFCFPCNGLGNIYRECGIYDKAIHYYKKAATIDETFMYPWNYMGDCFRYLEKYDIAFQCFKRAIELSNNDNVIMPLYGLGRIYYELGNRKNNNEKYYYKALEYFKSVEEKAPTYPPQIRFALKDMAQVYQKLGNYDEAIGKYDIIIGYGMFKKQRNYDDLIKYEKEICRNKLSYIKECNTLSASEDPAYYIMCRTFTQGIQKRVNDMKESFDVNFLRREKISISSFVKIKNDCMDNAILAPFMKETRETGNNNLFFEVLRRWNSYTPIIRDGRGGGYYLKVNDIGIVIDPGFNFIKNFMEAGHSFLEIDIILITHAHDDHTSDLESILNLHYRYNKLLKETVLVRDLAKELRISSNEVLNDERNKEIINKRYSECKKRLILLTSEGVICKYTGIFNEKAKQIKNEFNYNEIIGNKNQEYKDYEIFYKSFCCGDEVIINEELVIQAIRANHRDLIKDKQCLGFVIKLRDEIIVYTGDTGWYGKDRVSHQMQLEEIRIKNNKARKIVLIAHLGGFVEEENLYLNSSYSKDDVNAYYRNHLGRLGLVRVVEALQPDICLISEFGEEFNGLRIKLSEIFEIAFSKGNFNTKFIPADVGLRLNLDKNTANGQTESIPSVKVISGIDFKNKSIRYEYVSPEDVAVGEFRNKNALYYYKRGLNSVSDCIQAFLEGYIDDDDISGASLKLSF